MTLLDRLLGRQEPKPQKAVTGPGVAAYLSGNPLLSSLMGTPQQKMAAYLRAYRIGWFYKAGNKISTDLALLKVQVMPEDAAGDNDAAIVAADLSVPWERLDPIQQFLRLMERPNPYQTGRQLRKKTQIRRDFAGAAFWWLEGATSRELPTGVYGISPARMWPSYNKAGQLIGWVMDYDQPSGGVPFTTEEILLFQGEGTDDDYCPTGVVESVFSEVRLHDRIAQHTGDSLTLGSRMNGMLWPKERSLTEDEYQDTLRAWRNVTSDPNAGRRLLVFPEPMEYAAGGSTPAEVGIPELSAVHRDNILTAFPISPYMLGVPMPGGLNSAEIRREERRNYWEGTIHPRAEEFEEVVQTGLIARYEAVVGQTLDFEMEEPSLDDAPTLLEKAGALRSLVAVGFDAESAVEAVGLDHIKWNGLPKLVDPEYQAQQTEQAAAQGDGARVVVRDTNTRDSTATQQTLVGKAMDEPDPLGIHPEAVKVTFREDVIGREVSGSEEAVRGFLTAQRSRIIERIEALLPASKAARKALSDDWWDGDEEDALLLVALRDSYNRLGRGALQVVANTLSRVVLPDRIERVISANLKGAGTRIRDINETTRQAVTAELETGVRRGYNITQLVAGVPSESFRGIAQAPMKNGASAFDELRAETIARTETMNAYNNAAIRGYSEFGVREVQAIDGDTDAQCAIRNGGVFSVDDALGIADHPNGTLDWIPVLPERKSYDTEQPEVNAHPR